MSSFRSALLASLLSGVATEAIAHDSSNAPFPLDSPSLLDSDQLVLEALQRDTRRLLADHAIAGLVTARLKAPASLHAKMRRKGVGMDRIFDRLALRVRVESEADCYRVRQLIEARHRVIVGERDDYIANPKPNGYRSLHTAVHTDLGAVAEFQVRTHEMHAHAEYGDAAHWIYKATA